MLIALKESMRQELPSGLTGDVFGVSVFATWTVIHKVSRAIAKEKGQFLSLSENLADTKRKVYDVAHFPGVFGATRLYPHQEQTKKMLWHLLTESSFTPSTSKPFVIAMPL